MMKHRSKLLLDIVLILFFLALPMGQLGGIMLAPGIVVYIHDLILVILIPIGLLSGEKKNSIKPLLSIPIFTFITIAALSLLVNLSGYTSWQLFQSSLYLLRWIAYALLYFVVHNSRYPNIRWLTGLYVSGVIVGLAGIVQYFLYPTLRNLYYLGWDEHYYRLFSTFLDPNFAGIYLVLAFFTGVYLSGMVQIKRLFFISQTLLILAILLTYSRSTFLSFIVAVGVWLILTKKYLVGLIAVIFFTAAVLLLPTWGRDVLELTRKETITARTGNWLQSLDLFFEKPVLGHGFNTLRALQTERGWASDEPFPSRSAGGVDSSLLFVAVTTGIAGLCAYLFLLYRMVQLSLSALSIPGIKSVGQSYIISVLAVLVHSIFVNSLFYGWVMIWLWVYSGVLTRKITSDT